MQKKPRPDNMAFQEVIPMFALLSDPLNQLYSIFWFLWTQFRNHPFSPKFFLKLLLTHMPIDKNLKFRNPLYFIPDERLFSLWPTTKKTIFNTFSFLWSFSHWIIRKLWHWIKSLSKSPPQILSSLGKDCVFVCENLKIFSSRTFPLHTWFLESFLF